MNTSVPLTQDALAVTRAIQELLLIIFIHGFKGTDETFHLFPSRLENLLTEDVPGIKVECIVFPAYEVRQESSMPFNVPASVSFE
jgi:hypothetical protein